MIQNYNDFITALLKAGFSMGGGNSDGMYSVVSWMWNESPPYDTPVRWHTGDPETDPWEWRIRVLDERDDIAYSKVFFRKAGYITKEWYPYFLSVRRGGVSFEEAYADGLFSHYTKRIYETLLESGSLPLHEIKLRGGFSKEDKSRFDKALTGLQMGLFITMCGRQQKRGKTGEEYGWASTMFCAVEEFWPPEVFEKASKISPNEAEEAIAKRVYELNPAADSKKINKFILGR